MGANCSSASAVPTDAPKALTDEAMPVIDGDLPPWARENQMRPIKPGDLIPSVCIDHGFNPIKKVDMAERVKGKKVIIMGLPGAFTPC